MPERDPHQDARQDQPLEFQTVYAPAFYRGRLTGRGRWVPLYAHGDLLGVVWTDDDDGLGFLSQTPAGISRTPELAQAFSRAKAAGTPASDVFDYYASLAGMGLSAGPVESGSLDTLAE
jgi:hypothetical protein